MTTVESRPTTGRVTTPAALGALTLWFAAAVAAGGSGILKSLPVPLPVIAALISLVLAGCIFGIRPLRAWALGLGVRRLVAVHLVRFVGIAFLVAYRLGELPFAFAVPGGIGDILVAAGALVLLLNQDVRAGVLRPSTARIVRIWNAAGALDIVLVVATAGRLFIVDSGSTQALTHLPFSLLPTFFVPLIVCSHLLLFASTSRTAAR